jgi:cobalt-zinc-cadmium efflux system outer membrane protein
MRMQQMRSEIFILALCLCSGGGSAYGQSAPAQTPLAQTQGPVKITLDEAIQIAIQHNHTLLAERTTIQQSQAQETTANLRPNLTLSGDAQFLPFLAPGNFNSTYIDNNAQFDIGLGYLFERGQKRQRRLQAAKDQTAVTTSTVEDNVRTLTFQVSSQFVSVQLAESTLDLAELDMKSFQNTVDISQIRYKDGDISEDDYLKIKLQLLQFQTDVSQAMLAKVQALIGLRQMLGYNSVPADYDVAGAFDYQPVKIDLEDLQGKALNLRPDLRAALQGVTAAKSQYELARANGKQDVTASIDYSHTGEANSASIFGSIDLPVFNRNQGEIARTKFVIEQAEELQRAASEQVMTDVLNAYEGVQDNEKIVALYASGYLDEAKQDRDISEYAYKRGAASLLDFLDAERSYRATQLAYRQALASYLTALEQLREAVGTRSLP